MQNIQMTAGSGPATSETDKTFQTLRARLALAGHVLNRSDPSDGKRTYFVSSCNLVHELRTLDDVERFAQHPGGGA